MIEPKSLLLCPLRPSTNSDAVARSEGWESIEDAPIPRAIGPDVVPDDDVDEVDADTGDAVQVPKPHS